MHGSNMRIPGPVTASWTIYDRNDLMSSNSMIVLACVYLVQFTIIDFLISRTNNRVGRCQAGSLLHAMLASNLIRPDACSLASRDLLFKYPAG